MNQHAQMFLSFFLEQFPDSTEFICRKVTNIRLKAMNVDEDFDEMSKATAYKLMVFFDTLSEEDLREWLFGLLMSESKK